MQNVFYICFMMFYYNNFEIITILCNNFTNLS